jgi:hypothetical protein
LLNLYITFKIKSENTPTNIQFYKIVFRFITTFKVLQRNQI